MSDRNTVLRTLRAPVIEPTRVAYAYSKANNRGLTLATAAGQQLVAAGDGVVDLIAPLEAKWRNDLSSVKSLAIRIDHGHGVKTIVHGIAESRCQFGPVTRGQALGVALATQVFFAVEVSGTFVDPSHVNEHLGSLDGYLNFQRANSMRQAPDLLTATVSSIESLLYQGIRYFIPPSPVSVLFNLDFNGIGVKSGAAVTGQPGDFWNSIAALDFAPIPNAQELCYGGVAYPAVPGFFLSDWRGGATKVYFQRGALTSNAGSSDFFDPMLSTWVGGYNGVTPRVNSFTLRNLPAGTYDLYVYANGGTTNDTSTFYVSINGGAPTNKTATPTVASDWVENGNYVKFASLAVPQSGAVTVAAYGYLSGLQLKRQ